MELLVVGQRVREVRQALGWSQARLGELAGIPQSHVAKIESGADVRTSTLQRVLAALGYKLDLQRNARGLFLNPPAGSRLAAARDYGVDLGQLYAGYALSPADRLDLAVRNANGIAGLIP